MDIDIDFPSTFDVNALFPEAIPASMVKSGSLVKHPCGHYFQHIPIDDVTGLAAIPFEPAEDMGFMKIDFLHLSLLNQFSSKQEIQDLMKRPPNWKALQEPKIVDNLFQLRNSYELLCSVRPTSVQELADCVALIRPSKKHLAHAYATQRHDRLNIRKKIYEPPTDGQPWFKKAHAIAYALTIILQLHILTKQP